MDSPKTIDWFVTSKCNLSCDYCYGPIPEHEDSELLKKIAKIISKSAIKNVTLCGGEPFVNPNIVEIIEILKKNKKNVFVSCNGHFPNKLKEVLPLLTGVSISLDGYNNIENQKMRGRKSNFDRTNESIELVREFDDKKLKITTVLSKINKYQMENLGHKIRYYNPNIWRILQFVPRVKGYKNKDKFYISESEFQNIITNLQAKFTELNIYASNNIQISSCFLVDHWGNVILPNGQDYKIVGNCFDSNLIDCWKKNWNSKSTHFNNKLWMKEMNI